MHRTPALIASTAIVTAVLAGCASTSSTPAATVTATQAAVPASSPPSCLSRARQWVTGGGKGEVDAVTSDLGDIQKAGLALGDALSAGSDLSGPESALQSASASLQSDAQAAEADPPPSCIKGMRADYTVGMTDYGKAAANYQDGVSELSGGSESVALGDIEAGNAATTAGTKKVEAATGALQALEAGQ